MSAEFALEWEHDVTRATHPQVCVCVLCPWGLRWSISRMFFFSLFCEVEAGLLFFICPLISSRCCCWALWLGGTMWAHVGARKIQFWFVEPLIAEARDHHLKLRLLFVCLCLARWCQSPWANVHEGLYRHLPSCPSSENSFRDQDTTHFPPDEAGQLPKSTMYFYHCSDKVCYNESSNTQLIL